MVKLKNLAQSRTGKGFHLFLVRNWEKVSEAGELELVGAPYSVCG